MCGSGIVVAGVIVIAAAYLDRQVHWRDEQVRIGEGQIDRTKGAAQQLHADRVGDALHQPLEDRQHGGC